METDTLTNQQQKQEEVEKKETTEAPKLTV